MGNRWNLGMAKMVDLETNFINNLVFLFRTY